MTIETKITIKHEWVKLSDEIRGKTVSIICNSDVYYATTDDASVPTTLLGHKIENTTLKLREEGAHYVKVLGSFDDAFIYYESV